jgi:hypothetical protein
MANEVVESMTHERHNHAQAERLLAQRVAE